MTFIYKGPMGPSRRIQGDKTDQRTGEVRGYDFTVTKLAAPDEWSDPVDATIGDDFGPVPAKGTPVLAEVVFSVRRGQGSGGGRVQATLVRQLTDDDLI